MLQRVAWGGLSFLASYLGNSNSGSLPYGAAQVPPRGGRPSPRGRGGFTPPSQFGAAPSPSSCSWVFRRVQGLPGTPCPRSLTRLPAGLGWGLPRSCVPGLGGPATTGASVAPQMPPGTRSWVPGLPEATLASPDPLCPPFCFAFLSPHPFSSQPQDNFPLYKQLSCQEAISFQV